MKQLKRYMLLIVMVLLTGLLYLVDKGAGVKAVDTTLFALKEMLQVLPPIFVLLGLLDVWVPRETMIKFMGEKSGVLGVMLALILGSAAAGPLYAAFPIAAVFMRKGVKFSNILIFIGAWSTTKIPMLLFELASMGTRFTLTRLGLSLIGIFAIAFLINRAMDRKEIESIYKSADKL